MYRFVIAVCVVAVIACSDANVKLPEGTEPLSDDIAATVTKLKAERIDAQLSNWARENKRLPDDAEFSSIAADEQTPGSDHSPNDQWGTPFRLDRQSDSTWTVRSAGADRRFETDDDVTVLGVLRKP